LQKDEVWAVHLYKNLKRLRGKIMKKMISTIVSLFFVSLLFLPASSFAFNVGDKAPAFTAQSTQGEISLSAYAGKKNVVLALYFAVFTSV
jgi:hypothetical protein